MPTYEYLCAACDHRLELFQSMTERPKKKCPACGKLRLERQIGTGGGILFKGSGFYQTDYRSSSYKAGEAADKPSSSGSGDAKDAAKSAPKGESKQGKGTDPGKADA
jgi:putative FmdB family regulatory protein